MTKIGKKIMSSKGVGPLKLVAYRYRMGILFYSMFFVPMFNIQI